MTRPQRTMWLAGGIVLGLLIVALLLTVLDLGTPYFNYFGRSPPDAGS